jgi:hypothetical protein
MNMFVLDTDPIKAVEGMYKAHITKMPLESTQLLSTAVRLLGGKAPYKPYNPGSRLVKWIIEHPDNYAWLWNHALGLFIEFHERRGKHHGALKAFQTLPDPVNNTIIPYSLPPLYMDEEFRKPCKTLDDVVECYRKMYKFQKSNLINFEEKEAPEWFNTLSYEPHATKNK